MPPFCPRFAPCFFVRSVLSFVCGWGWVVGPAGSVSRLRCSPGRGLVVVSGLSSSRGVSRVGRPRFRSSASARARSLARLCWRSGWSLPSWSSGLSSVVRVGWPSLASLSGGWVRGRVRLAWRLVWRCRGLGVPARVRFLAVPAAGWSVFCRPPWRPRLVAAVGSLSVVPGSVGRGWVRRPAALGGGLVACPWWSGPFCAGVVGRVGWVPASVAARFPRR